MLPNHYEVEVVSRIRREEAAQQAIRDRLRRSPEPQGDNRPVKIERGMNPLGRLRQRLTLIFKRRDRMAAKSVTDYR